MKRKQKLTKKQTAAKTAKFRATMAAKRRAGAGIQGVPFDAIPGKPGAKSKPPKPKNKSTATMHDRALDLIETGLLILKGLE